MKNPKPQLKQNPDGSQTQCYTNYTMQQGTKESLLLLESSNCHCSQPQNNPSQTTKTPLRRGCLRARCCLRACSLPLGVFVFVSVSGSRASKSVLAGRGIQSGILGHIGGFVLFVRVLLVFCYFGCWPYVVILSPGLAVSVCST